jgi:hypothetical protein
LRADEAYQDRRRYNIAGFGAAWLKPPGVAKTLFQLREERREAEEHAEALRREALAMQLADAEAVEADEGAADVMEEDGMAEERDLDDDVPDMDAEGFGFDGAGSDVDDDDDASSRSGVEPEAHEMRHVRANEDRIRGIMAARAEGAAADLFGGEDEIDEEEAAAMLEEEDLAGHAQMQSHLLAEVEDGFDMDMDADLDGEIPEAEESGMGYEHTDTEASMTSDDEDLGRFAQPSSSQNPRFRSSVARSDANSLDISSLLSGGAGSAFGSSPNIRRRP